MKNLRGVLGGLLIVVVFQFTLVSCVDNSEIIKNENSEQIHSKVTPSHGGGGDYDDEDDGV